jgi:hypothetical protein
LNPYKNHGGTTIGNVVGQPVNPSYQTLRRPLKTGSDIRVIIKPSVDRKPPSIFGVKVEATPHIINIFGGALSRAGV